MTNCISPFYDTVIICLCPNLDARLNKTEEGNQALRKWKFPIQLYIIIVTCYFHPVCESECLLNDIIRLTNDPCHCPISANSLVKTQLCYCNTISLWEYYSHIDNTLHKLYFKWTNIFLWHKWHNYFLYLKCWSAMWLFFHHFHI